MYGNQEKNLGQKVNVKFFTVDPYSVSVSWTKTRACAPLKNRCRTFWGGGNFIKTVTIKRQLDMKAGGWEYQQI